MDGVYYDAKGNLLGIVSDVGNINRKFPMKSDVIDIVHCYSCEKQKLKACEELCELQEVLLKDVNKPLANDVDRGVVEELADVYIMLAQLEIIYDVDIQDLFEMIAYKLDRQRGRMRAGV